MPSFSPELQLSLQASLSPVRPLPFAFAGAAFAFAFAGAAFAFAFAGAAAFAFAGAAAFAFAGAAVFAFAFAFAAAFAFAGAAGFLPTLVLTAPWASARSETWPPWTCPRALRRPCLPRSSPGQGGSGVTPELVRRGSLSDSLPPGLRPGSLTLSPGLAGRDRPSPRSRSACAEAACPAAATRRSRSACAEATCPAAATRRSRPACASTCSAAWPCRSPRLARRLAGDRRRPALARLTRQLARQRRVIHRAQGRGSVPCCAALAAARWPQPRRPRRRARRRPLPRR